MCANPVIKTPLTANAPNAAVSPFYLLFHTNILFVAESLPFVQYLFESLAIVVVFGVAAYGIMQLDQLLLYTPDSQDMTQAELAETETRQRASHEKSTLTPSATRKPKKRVKPVYDEARPKTREELVQRVRFPPLGNTNVLHTLGSRKGLPDLMLVEKDLVDTMFANVPVQLDTSITSLRAMVDGMPSLLACVCV